MSEQTPVNGSIEILTADGRDNRSLLVEAATPADIPVILRAVYGFGDVAELPPKHRKGRPPKGEWQAINKKGQPMTALLWEDVEFTDTEIGQSLAAAIASQDGDAT